VTLGGAGVTRDARAFCPPGRGVSEWTGPRVGAQTQTRRCSGLGLRLVAMESNAPQRSCPAPCPPTAPRAPQPRYPHALQSLATGSARPLSSAPDKRLPQVRCTGERGSRPSMVCPGSRGLGPARCRVPGEWGSQLGAVCQGWESQPGSMLGAPEAGVTAQHGVPRERGSQPGPMPCAWERGSQPSMVCPGSGGLSLMPCAQGAGLPAQPNAVCLGAGAQPSAVCPGKGESSGSQPGLTAWPHGRGAGG